MNSSRVGNEPCFDWTPLLYVALSRFLSESNYWRKKKSYYPGFGKSTWDWIMISIHPYISLTLHWMQNKFSWVIKQTTVSKTACGKTCYSHCTGFKRSLKTCYHGRLEFYKVCYSSVRNLHMKFSFRLLGESIKPFWWYFYLFMNTLLLKGAFFSLVWLQIIPSASCHSSILVPKSKWGS